MRQFERRGSGEEKWDSVLQYDRVVRRIEGLDKLDRKSWGSRSVQSIPVNEGGPDGVIVNLVAG